MNAKELIEREDELFCKRVLIHLYEPTEEWYTRISKEAVWIKPDTVELTYHGLDECSGTCGDDTIGFVPEEIKSIEAIRDPTPNEMGAIEKHLPNGEIICSDSLKQLFYGDGEQ